MPALLLALHIHSLSPALQMSGWWFLTFTAFEIKEKVEYVSGVEHLKDIAPIQQLQLPTFIMEYDRKVRRDGGTHSELGERGRFKKKLCIRRKKKEMDEFLLIYKLCKKEINVSIFFHVG